MGKTKIWLSLYVEISTWGQTLLIAVEALFTCLFNKYLLYTYYVLRYLGQNGE